MQTAQQKGETCRDFVRWIGDETIGLLLCQNRKLRKINGWHRKFGCVLNCCWKCPYYKNRLRKKPRKLFTVKVEYKIQDCWIGIYWKREKQDFLSIIEMWICILPVFPIHLKILSYW